MSAGLTTEQEELLDQVRQGRVAFLRGRYLIQAERRDVTAEVQVLRAMGLVRLFQAPSRRIPPTRLCELTERGAQVWTDHEAA